MKVFLDTREFNRFIDKSTKKLKNTKKPLKRMARVETEAAQYRIRTSKQTPDGQPWAAWAYSTFISRIRNGTVGTGPLYVSGLLMRSFKSRVTSTKATISNTAPYATYLQEGTDNMPARPFMGFGRESHDRINDIMMEHLEK